MKRLITNENFKSYKNRIPNSISSVYRNYGINAHAETLCIVGNLLEASANEVYEQHVGAPKGH